MQDFNRRTRQLLATARHGRVGIREFEKQFPKLADQLRRDAKTDLFDYWGCSWNIDEIQNQRIVDRRLLATIGRLANYPIRMGKAYHAGLIHTYGYLLSDLKTRYGYKRDRWCSGVIEKGLEMPRGLFSHSPPTGTLLGNVTFLLASLSYGNGANSALSSKLVASEILSEELASFPFRKTRRTRIREVVNLEASTKSNVAVELLTDLVAFRKPIGSIDALVVYSYLISGEHKLVTCFPIERISRLELVREALESTSPILPRYNLSLPGFPKSGIAGRRIIADDS